MAQGTTLNAPSTTQLANGVTTAQSPDAAVRAAGNDLNGLNGIDQNGATLGNQDGLREANAQNAANNGQGGKCGGGGGKCGGKGGQNLANGQLNNGQLNNGQLNNGQLNNGQLVQV